MISYRNKYELENILSALFTYTIENGYSLNAVGDYIANSFFATELESNNDSFLFDFSLEEIIKDILHLQESPLLNKNDFVIANWMAMIFLAIFFQYKKSWSYIFLYLSPEEAYNMFDLYHEMDISQTFLYFQDKVKETNLLPKIIKLKGYTTKQLAVLSGININTLNGYSKSDDILFGASNRNIKLISQILKVRDEIFLEHLFISEHSGEIIFDNEKPQLTKDSFLYTNTKCILEDIEFFNGPNPTYEELIKLINDFEKTLKENKLVINVNNVDFDLKTKRNLFLVSKDQVKDIKKNKIKEVPSIVKEYAFIKADVRPYGDKYKL